MDEPVWHLIRDERLSLAQMLEGLPEERWATRSLCEEWSVRDVLAHLVMTPAGEPRPWTMTKALLRARGRLWTAGRDVAVTYARRSPGELVSSLRASAELRTKPVFVVSQNILLDLVVHGQDIAVPLALPRPVPDAAAVLSLQRIWAMGWPFRARRRLAGVRLECQGDATPELVWEAGSGPQVRGSAGDLALLMTGRIRAALPHLVGPGVEMIAARLHPAGASY
ncbi:maleylpyruvate isomerase family mycothiol-dependent enzyme [Nocardioides panaciterrulae]|uniref:Uncharacterized protein (TIGR03083 family) n=1 Tax=Nocardioides panaciterrulae TaxID=661492 RepID=A0A7Y9E7H2_9ACTN|nr:maleylpyruvate isomerase family mycothiol-dependent enzyme [Nocardioides panaciterrulae]NYD42613.1 uncharacterized protein (TIGR03083 family) [Nocardioides panaciterrulae]